jgi:predicted MPP superfamily phosphohydrolase
MNSENKTSRTIGYFWTMGFFYSCLAPLVFSGYFHPKKQKKIKKKFCSGKLSKSHRERFLVPPRAPKEALLVARAIFEKNDLGARGGDITV